MVGNIKLNLYKLKTYFQVKGIVNDNSETDTKK